jgi:hypothetical protein
MRLTGSNSDVGVAVDPGMEELERLAAAASGLAGIDTGVAVPGASLMEGAPRQTELCSGTPV